MPGGIFILDGDPAARSSAGPLQRGEVVPDGVLPQTERRGDLGHGDRLVRLIRQCPAMVPGAISPAWNSPSAPLPTLANLWVTMA